MRTNTVCTLCVSRRHDYCCHINQWWPYDSLAYTCTHTHTRPKNAYTDMHIDTNTHETARDRRERESTRISTPNALAAREFAFDENDETDTSIWLMEIDPVTWYAPLRPNQRRIWRSKKSKFKAEERETNNNNRTEPNCGEFSFFSFLLPGRLYRNAICLTSQTKKNHQQSRIESETKSIELASKFQIEIRNKPNIFCRLLLRMKQQRRLKWMRLAHPWFVTTPSMIISVHSIDVHMCSTRSL